MPQQSQIPPLVLIVDDQDDNREMYAQYLEFAGLRVIQASNGREALHIVESDRPNVVVLDLSMPEMDGWEACRCLKAGLLTKKIPVLVVSAHALDNLEHEAWQAGCDRFLRKPCLPEDLLAAIRQQLDALGGEGRAD